LASSESAKVKRTQPINLYFCPSYQTYMSMYICIHICTVLNCSLLYSLLSSNTPHHCRIYLHLHHDRSLNDLIVQYFVFLQCA
jgi:hypothetical protein